MTYHHGNLRQTLLDRAAEIIAESSVEALSLRKLARDIGVSHGAPARHFKDKSALLNALAHEGHLRMSIALDKAVEAAGMDPLARHNAMGKATIKFALKNPTFYNVMNHPDVLKHADAKLNAYIFAQLHLVQTSASDAREAGWLPDQDPLTVFAFSTAAAIGAASLLTARHETDFFEGIDVEKLADQIIDVVIPPSLKALKALQEIEP
ncbi:MAG: AcrR family transcriptional regulator [Parvibaculaceae bacterium]|jgi:AcrR family transcriptional regulator|nr:TetR/AcrR family transcriptional regulator [Parvibaculaceae bacterium]